MKAVIVSSFDTYLERIELLKEYYESVGYETIVIVSNFKHFKKEFIKEKKNEYLYVDTKPYYRNLSFKRLYSHYDFSKNAFNKINGIKPNLLHVLIPANSLAKEARIYKDKNSNVKLILDLIDLWPETIPIGRLKETFPFKMWRNVRDNNLINAELIFTECNLYKDILHKENDSRFKTLYWAKKENNICSKPKLSNTEVHLCYLGSINNIIDIDCIIEVCRQFSKAHPVIFEIIGDGEKKEELISKLTKININILDHGIIYDKDKKQKIFDRCHFGLNIYKESVCIGLTMKSLDYLQAGIPIINNIKGDTQFFVNEYNIGYNLNLNEYENIDKFIENNLNMRKKSIEIWEEYFSKKAFFKQLDLWIKM